MGIRTVVAYSTADARSRAVTLADESICIGPPEPRQSYLNIPSIISAASITECEAIHPGYGLLSENSTFAEVCRACGITFIGPSPEAIRLMGDKAQARGMARAAGAPVVPGSQGPLDGVDEAQATGRRGRLSRHGQGRLRRRRPGDAHRPRARIAGARLCHVPVRSARLLRILRSVSGEVRRGGASRRGPGAGRPERDPRPHGRARLLDPAPPPEAPRGVACHVHLPGHARGAVQVRARRRQCRQLRLRGHGGVPRRPRRQLLLHRDEHADPGGASRHRAGHRIRPRPRADPHRRGRVPRLQAGRHPVEWARHRVPDQCRGPRALHPLSGPRHGLGASGRARGPRGQPPDGRLRGPADTTIRSSRRSSCTGATAPRRWPGCTGPSRRPSWRGSRPPSPFI